MTRELSIKTYKVPITRNKDGTIVEEPLDLNSYELLYTETIEIENIQVELPEITQKIAKSNKLSRALAEGDIIIDYITLKILTK